jgi:putative ABC transport system permease protein
MFRLTIKELAARKLRLFSTALAVFLGVAFLAGTLMLTDTVTKAFDGVLSDAHEGTDAYVRGASPLDLSIADQRPRIDGSLADELRTVTGVGDVAVSITGYAQVVDRDGEPVGDVRNAPAFGLNWVDVDALNPYQLARGRAPMADDEVVIDEHSARSAGFAPGDRTTVLTQGEPRPVTIVGTARFGDADSIAGASTVIFSTHGAETMLGEPGMVDGIAFRAADGVSQDQLVASLAGVVGDRAEAISGDALTKEQQDEIHENIAGFATFMLVFAGVAMFVGAFIINNTFSITVAQRTREMAMLRAVGASGRQVTRTVLAEAVAVGAIASAAGFAGGFGVATALKALLSSVGLDIPDGAPVIQVSTVVASLATGMLVTFVSAVLPARRAAKVPPIAALRDVAVERTSGSKRRTATGVAVAGGGVGVLLAGLDRAEPAMVGLGAVAVFIGVSVLGPVLARPVARVLGAPVAALRGMTGSIARQNAVRNPKRTARTAASLMIGVALVGFISIFAASVKASLSSGVEKDFRGTHIVDSGAFDGTFGLSPQLAAELRTTPGVSTVSERRIASVEVDGSANTWFSGYDPTTIASIFDLGHVEGDLGSLGADGMAVYVEPDQAGEADSPKLGDTVNVTFATGTKPFVVRATYDHSDEWVGKEFVGVGAFDANVPTPLDAQVFVVADSTETIERVADAHALADVLDKDGFVDSKNANIDMMLKLIYALLGLAVVIALIGITNTLALSVHERRREIGLMRAVGMSRSQVRSAVRWESVIIALFGTVLGLGVGIFFGWAMVGALGSEGINTFCIPLGALAIVTIGGAMAGILAAVSPARGAAKVDILRAVAST